MNPVIKSEELESPVGDSSNTDLDLAIDDLHRQIMDAMPALREKKLKWRVTRNCIRASGPKNISVCPLCALHNYLFPDEAPLKLDAFLALERIFPLESRAARVAVGGVFMWAADYLPKDLRNDLEQATREELLQIFFH